MSKEELYYSPETMEYIKVNEYGDKIGSYYAGPTTGLTPKPFLEPKPISTGDLLGQILKELFNKNYRFRKVGSSNIEGCTPDDLDILIYDPDKTFEHYLRSKGCVEGGSKIPDQDFTSYKVYDHVENKTLNALVYYNEEDYENFVKAQEICEGRKIVYKPERAAVFDYIMKRKEAPSLEEFTKIITKPTPEQYPSVAW